MAVHSRDHRHFEVEERNRQPLDAPPVFVANLEFAYLIGALPPHSAQVPARGKRRAIAREDHAAHIGLVLDALDGGQELRHGRVARERIPPLGLVHGERDDGTLPVIQQEIVHSSQTIGAARVCPIANRSASIGFPYGLVLFFYWTASSLRIKLSEVTASISWHT